MSIIQEKQALRKKVKQLKQAYSLAQKKELSLLTCQRIEENEIFQQAKTVMAYWSMDDEVFTHDFVQRWAQHKNIILPVVNGDELELKIDRKHVLHHLQYLKEVENHVHPLFV